jgi:hypothetical protein
MPRWLCRMEGRIMPILLGECERCKMKDGWAVYTVSWEIS